MTLDPDYLRYPKRRRGMDHDLYGWSNLFERRPIRWPDGAKVAVTVMVAAEYFPLTVGDAPLKAPGHMATPYPDLRHYSAREYGTRLGLYRLLDAFAAARIPVSVAMNAAIAERYPAIPADVAAGGHEIVAYSTDMNGILYGGMDEAAEAALIDAALDRLERVTGTRPRGWRSVAQSQSLNTPRMLAERGIVYACDWVNDDLPYAQRTDAGPLINLPMNHELSDRQIILNCQQSAEAYVRQVEDAYDWLAQEAERFGGRLLTLTLTPYVAGLPFRIAAVEELLKRLAARPGAWFATAAQVVDAWQAQQP